MHGIVVDWVAQNASNTPDKTAIIELPSGRRQTYAQMHDRVGRIAGWLTSLGVERGDRVGVLALNSADTMAIIFATWRIGAVHLALNFRLTASELDYIIGNAEPKVLIHDRDVAETVAGLSVSIPHIVEMEGQGADSEFEQAIASAEPVEKMVELLPDDQCLLMYSSGTTGLPKGVIITHNMMVWASINMANLACGPDMVGLTVMPLFHIGGLQVFTCPCIYFGGTSVIVRAFDPGLTLDAFNDRELGITHFLGVPAIFNALRDHPKNAQTDFSHLQMALAGAEAVPAALVHWWNDRGLVIQEGYGMTENVASCCVMSYDQAVNKVGSAGKTLRHVQLRAVDSQGRDVPAGQTGELVCRGPVVTPGYWRRPEVNEESFIDGWFRTGDIGSIDAEGYVRIEDRVKDMYISGGENVYPAEVENILYELKEIRELAVIGVPDERWGETGCAVVVLQEGAELSAEQILEHVRPRLATFKHPTHVVFVDVLPRNATGKVQKFKLREQISV